MNIAQLILPRGNCPRHRLVAYKKTSQLQLEFSMGEPVELQMGRRWRWDIEVVWLWQFPLHICRRRKFMNSDVTPPSTTTITTITSIEGETIPKQEKAATKFRNLYENENVLSFRQFNDLKFLSHAILARFPCLYLPLKAASRIIYFIEWRS